MTEQSIGALTQNIVRSWEWWQKALKDPSKIGSKELPVHDGDAQQGYYRTKNRDKTFDPVAIFYPEGSTELVAYRAGREVRPEDIWSWCCKHPISYENYNSAISGNGWLDYDGVVSKQVSAPVPAIGDNSGDVSAVDSLKDQIDSALANMKAYETIKDDETAAKALSLRNRLNELSGQADKIRVKEKEPHLAAGKAVDETWQPLVKSAKAGADKVKAAIAAFETAKLMAERKRQQEAMEAEKARIASQQAQEAQESSVGIVVTPEEEIAPVAAPVSIKPAYGKAASVQVKKVVTDVTDWKALAVYMSAHAECQELLRKLAQRAIDAGRVDVPGITIEEKAQIR